MRNETEEKAPLPPNPLPPANPTELFLLEKLLEEDLRCESDHIHTGKESCSVKVTHLNMNKHRRRRVLVCKVSADWDMGYISRHPDEQCKACAREGFSRTISECWSYQPI